MSFVLDICNETILTDPTDLQIRQAVLGLDLGRDSAFVILGPADDEEVFMQASGDPSDGFSVEFQESAGGLFRATNDFSAEQLIAALIYYRNGTSEWRAFSPWEPVEG